MQAISLKEDDAENDQLELRDLQEQLRHNQSALRELGQRVQELHQLLIESIQL